MKGIIMIYEIMNRIDASKAAEETDSPATAIISITDISDDKNILKQQPWLKAVLKLQSNNLPEGKKGCITLQQAKEIADFAIKNYNCVERFIVYGEYEHRRSAGITAAISEYFEGHDSGIFAHPDYIPSKACFNYVLNALRECEIKNAGMNNPDWRESLKVKGELIKRIFSRGNCITAISDYFHIPKAELIAFIRESGEFNYQNWILWGLKDDAIKLAEEPAACKVCNRAGKMYRIGSSYRSLCKTCLRDRLDGGNPKYEQYLWTIMTDTEIYEQIEECWVGCFTASKGSGEWRMVVHYIGTKEGAEAWYAWQDQACDVIPGRFPQRNKDVIFNCAEDMKKIIGTWSTKPAGMITDKAYTDHLILLPDGTGRLDKSVGNSRWDSSKRQHKISWYAADDMLNITLDDKTTFFYGELVFEEVNLKNENGSSNLFETWYGYGGQGVFTFKQFYKI